MFTGFTKAGYGWFLGFLIALVILVALASLTRVAVKAVNAATTDNQKKITTVAVAAAATMFFVSLVRWQFVFQPFKKKIVTRDGFKIMF